MTPKPAKDRDSVHRWLLTVASVLALWYGWLGYRAAQWPIYYENELLFRADTAEVADELCFRDSPANKEAFVHPIFTIFAKPIGAFLYSLTGSTVVTSRLVIGGFGLGAALFLWLFVRALGAGPATASAWTFLYALAATPSLFSSIPERYAFGSFSQAALIWGVWARRHSNLALVGTGVMSGGSALTNLAPWALFWLFSRVGDRPIREWPLGILRMAGWSLLVIALLVAFHFAGSLIWPDTLATRNHEMMLAKGQFFLKTTSWEVLYSRALLVLRHLVLYPVAPPEPALVVQPGGEAVFTYTITPAAKYKWPGLLAACAWIFFLAASLLRWPLAAPCRRALGLASALVLLFHLLLHLVYGDDFFLYTSHWHPVLIAWAALSIIPNTRPLDRWMPWIMAAVAANASLQFFQKLDVGIRKAPLEAWRIHQQAHVELAQKIADILRQDGTDVVYLPKYLRYLQYPLRALGITAVDLLFEPDPNRRLRAEAAPRVAILAPDDGFRNFLETTGGSAVFHKIGQVTLATDIQPPQVQLEMLSPEAIKDIRDAEGRSWKDALVDYDIYSSWRPPYGAPMASLTIEFAKPVAVAAVQILPIHFRHLRPWQVFGRISENQEWMPLAPAVENHGFSWIGQRPFFGGYPRPLEARFQPITLSEIRLVVMPSRERGTFRITEVRVLGPAAQQHADEQRPTNAIDLLAHLKPGRIYADRQVSALLRRTRDPRQVSSFEDLHRYRRYVPMSKDKLQMHVIPCSGRTLFIVPPEMATRERAVLAAYSRSFHEADASDRCILGVDHLAPENDVALKWIGDRLFMDSRIDPTPAREGRAPVLADFGREGRLHRLRIIPDRPEPGQRITIETTWSIERPLRNDRPIAFMHFVRKNRISFQADHPHLQDWPKHLMLLYSPGVHFRQRTYLDVPENTEPGTYDLQIGLWWPERKERIRPRSAGKVHNRALIIPSAIIVERTTSPSSSDQNQVILFKREGAVGSVSHLASDAFDFAE